MWQTSTFASNEIFAGQGTLHCFVCLFLNAADFHCSGGTKKGGVPAIRGYFASLSCFVLTSSAAAASASQLEQGCGTCYK